MTVRMFKFLSKLLCEQQSCLLCKQSSNALICNYCQVDIEHLPLANYQHNLLLWPKAASGLKQTKFDQLVALGDYQWPLSQLLTQLKFSGKVLHAAALAQVFHRLVVPDLADKPAFILPVPLHWTRVLTRKYNQSELIAKQLSQMTGIPLKTDVVSRHKATPAQTKLNAQQRRNNLKHAFRLENPVQAKHIVIFDDVVTTGSTVNALAKLLRTTNPKLRIDVWTICLTLEH